jgi:hypothetical protein
MMGIPGPDLQIVLRYRNCVAYLRTKREGGPHKDDRA